MSSQTKRNAINWFEIPAVDFERARTFYTQVLGGELKLVDAPGAKMGFLPADEGAVTGAIIQTKDHVPSKTGVLVFLNAGPDIRATLTRAEKAGATVTMPVMNIGEYGYMAKFVDTEGNLIALHSMA